MSLIGFFERDNVSFPLSRRSLIKGSSIALTASILPQAKGTVTELDGQQGIHVNLNENAWGPSEQVRPAVERELRRVARYADAHLAQSFAEQIAAYERVSDDQVVLGEILGPLGLFLGSRGGPGGEFVYSTPGYLALIDAAWRVGGVGVPVPLNDRFENDLPALQAKAGPKTRAFYLINPHNPTGTVSDSSAFSRFLQEIAQHAPVIVDEAYLEYTPDFAARSAAQLVRDGADVLVFRTFDKVHGLAGLPIGYTLAPRKLAAALRAQGLGDAESLGRLNIAAASAALADTQHVARVRDAVAAEREKWNAKLDELKIRHTNARANFVFFDSGRAQPELAGLLRKDGIDIGRAFPPYANWARITIGLPEENAKIREALEQLISRG